MIRSFAGGIRKTGLVGGTLPSQRLTPAAYAAEPSVSSITPAFGGATDEVVLAGVGFTQNPTVTIGGIAVDNKVIDSDIQITCDVPSGVAVGAVDVVVGGSTLEGGFVQLLTEVDFDDFANTAALVADWDVDTRWGDSPALQAQISVETSSGPTVGGKARSNWMKYQYRDQTDHYSQSAVYGVGTGGYQQVPKYFDPGETINFSGGGTAVHYTEASAGGTDTIGWTDGTRVPASGETLTGATSGNTFILDGTPQLQGCTGVTIHPEGWDVRDTPASGSQSEIWGEATFKVSTSPQWNTATEPSWWAARGCSSGAAYKLLQGTITGASGRWGHGFVGDNTIGLTTPDNSDGQGNVNISALNLLDGNWHTYRWHWKHESSPGASDAEAWFEIDGTEIWNVTGFTTNNGASALTRFGFGANMNYGTEIEYWSGWGHLRIWNTDPGF